jgi:hypothetical protein
MTKSKLRKIAIILSSLAVLSGGFGIDTAYARGGGGFGGGGHIGGFAGGGFGGGHIGEFGGDHIGGQLGGGHLSGGFGGDRIGADHIGGAFVGGHFNTGLVGDHMSGGLGSLHTGGVGDHLGLGGGLMDRGSVGTDHFAAPIEDHAGALTGVHPGATNFDHSRDHRRVREEDATPLLCEGAIMVDPACGQTNPVNTP